MPRSAAILAVLALAGPLTADERSAELKKFAGTWKVRDGSADGRPLPDEARKASRLVFDGNRFAFRGGPTEPHTTFAIDPARQTIEIAPPKGETRALRGRYRFEGGTLTLCLTDADAAPDALEAGKDRLLLVLERDK